MHYFWQMIITNLTLIDVAFQAILQKDFIFHTNTEIYV